MDRDATSSASVQAWPPRAALATVDGQGVVIAWSAAAQRLLGYEPGEVIGRDAMRLLPEPLPDPVLRCCAEYRAWRDVITVRHRDGRLLRVGLEATALWDARGEVQWSLASPAHDWAAATGTGGSDAWDMTEIKSWAMEQLPLPMALYDRHGLRMAVNAAMTRTLGKPERELLGLPLGYSRAGQHIKGLEGLDATVEQVWQSGRTVRLEEHFRPADEAHTRAVMFSLYPVKDRTGQTRAVALAPADITEQFHARQRLSILNDAGLRIGTTLDLTRTAEELAEVGTDHFADFAVIDLLDSVMRDHPTETIPSSPVFRRVAQRSVLPGCPEAVMPIGTVHSHPEDSPPARALAACRALPHYIDDTTRRWWATNDPERARVIDAYGFHSSIAAPLRARETTLGVAIFIRHRTPEPFDEDDLRLAEDLAARAAVCVDNARRYTHERRTALTLQNSLLPLQGPRQAAVEVAHRYLPADPAIGIGGDWFDVIPLSGARVALVVGDVVGHGIEASATMGRLCTAVRTLADIDLAPDELLTQLDDLVLRLDREATPGEADGPNGEVGATCLYAVYDPVSRLCSMATAGHLTPTLATPDGTVHSLDLPVGPPLGVGGLPFETKDFDIPEGSILACYTDGLVEGIDRDMDVGRSVLQDALADAHDSLEDTCDTALESLRPDLRTDDAILLLARTRALDVGQVAGWDLIAEPAVVAHARKLADDQLLAWNLADLTFISELVISELVTNAIRYGHPPVHLRLIRDTSLIVEVSDGSSTAPHLRRARAFDEGGRGLLIVAQLTQRWGCRHAPTGKTIWAEIPLATQLA
ncbi:SpoIIE family protein phosphatase [Streptomyces sp. NPDC051677]|uniref:SpoIIE family protein phosphatase n=1 Tax=Streptomyces sp. NPDC051677 TaxID=3365669 RepID=UPI0037D4AF45